MAFRKRGLTSLRDWEPDTEFNEATDRLLVATSKGDEFIARMGPEDDDGSTFIVDKQFMPSNLASLPHKLKRFRSLPLEWDAAQFPWETFLYDGEMTHDGPYLLVEAVGIGWTCPINADFTIAHIEPVHIDDVAPIQLAKELRGVHFGEFTVNESALYDEAMRM